MFNRLAALCCALLLMLGSANPGRAQEVGAQYWQCAPFARVISGIQIFGNAGTWWNQAEGRYERGQSPQVGAVLAFKAGGAMRVGHVATVSEVVDARTIKVTHANWSPIGGQRGQVEENVEVIDVSENNDWSAVRVWYAPLQDIGTRTNATYGFIYPDTAARQLAKLDQPAAGPVLMLAAAVLEPADDVAGDASGVSH